MRIQSKLFILFLAIIASGAIAFWGWQAGSPSVISNPPSVSSSVSSGPDISEVLKRQPGPNASPSEMKAFFDYIDSVAISTDTVTVSSGCKLSPAVIKLQKDAVLTFKNNDSLVHYLDSPDWTVTAPAQGQVSVKADKGGPHGYNCDKGSLSTTSGLYFVTE